MTKRQIQDDAAKLCGLLCELGYEYHTEGDNRGSSHRSVYIIVRRPRYMEIRVSDHPMNKIKRAKTFDIGPHGTALEQAIKDITEWHAGAHLG
jgi:hypothetical protein